MSGFVNKDVIAGPVTFMITATTIGHTESGVKITGTAKYNEVKSHESGDVPVVVWQIGPRRFEIEAQLLEVNCANFPLVFPDAAPNTTTGGTWVKFHSSEFGSRSVALNNVKVIQKNAVGSNTTFTINKMVPMPGSLNIIAKNADNTKWLLDAKFVALFPSGTTGTLATISGL